MKLARRFALVLAVTVAAAVPLIGAAPPAGADPCLDWHNGDDMIDSTCGRGTFVLDPGRFQVLTRAGVLEHRAYYEARGFSANFLWYAPEGYKTVEPRSPVRWSGCDIDPAPGQPCPPSALHFNEVIDAFSDDDRGVPIQLRSLMFRSGFIALVCGNFTEGGSEKPVPTIRGVKFHDQDRDGVRDPGEPGLANWRMTLHRDRSDAGQGTGEVASVLTDANGSYEFRLDGHLPGDYAVTEEGRADWVRTTSPDRHVIRVEPGVGDRAYGGNDFGNVETSADAVKVAFDVVDAPAEMPADAETTVNVRAVLENRGPAPIIDVTDTLSASGPADCTFRLPMATADRRLVIGQPVTVVFPVGVTCTEPSFHPLEFRNDLDVTTAGVTDPDGSNNRRSTGATIAVIDESDIAITGTELDCAARTYVDDRFTCTVTTTVVNHGDHATAGSDVQLGLTGPPDCVLAPIGTTRHENLPVSTTAATVVATSWDIACGDRSYHDFAATSHAVLDHLHVIDPDLTNNAGSAADRVEVFERVDLSVADLRITCSERQYAQPTTTCVSTVTVANAGPATTVRTLTTVGLTAPSDCTVTPTGDQVDSRVLDTGTSATFTKAWTLTCSQPRRHTFATTATIAADEPHPEDTDRANDTRTITWQPVDIKPRSFPSSINLTKDGIVPVAILSTIEFDAVTLVDQATLTFGATGTEPSWIRCGGSPEDVNDDGLADLVCLFDTGRTGLSCDSTTATVMGRTIDGRQFEGQDDVKITRC